MLHKIINSTTLNYSKLKDKSVFLSLFFTALFLRFPFFFRDYIDHDESTFILMGQSIVDGHLPYTELWDLKPPIIFLIFASVIYTFGKSFLAIRLLGVFIVTISSFYSYKIATLIAPKKVGFWIAIIAICLQSMFGSLQGVMSEHISIMFFMPGLYLLIKHKKKYWILIAGLLMGLSLMSKLNIAYTILGLCLFLFYKQFYKTSFLKAFTNMLYLGLGILIIILLTIFPYYLNSQTEVWWNNVVLASLKYADIRVFYFHKFAPIFIFLIVTFFFSWKKNLLNFKDSITQILIATIISILFSLVMGGKINGHYLLQLHPVLIIPVGIIVSNITYFKKLNYKPYVLIILMLLPVEAYLEYINICKNKIEKNTFYNGEGFAVPSYIKENNLDYSNIFFLEYHIGYWMLDKKPITKAATHPNNICREKLFRFYKNPRESSLNEIQYIMEEIRPKIIVARKTREIFFSKKLIKENEYMNAYMTKYYKKLVTVDNAQIFSRL